MKSDLSLADLKNFKKNSKKSSQIEFEFFFDSEYDHETRTSVFIAFSLLEMQNSFIFWREIYFEILFL